MAAEVHVLILSTADWDRPIWTNKQHLAVQFAQRTQVTYVESLGLRRPSLNVADIRRIGARLAKLLGRGRTSDPNAIAGKPRPANITVVTPTIIPFHRRNGPTWFINKRLLHRQVADWLKTPQKQRVLWTFSPVTYGLETYAAKTVYHCVDLLGSFPSVDERAIHNGEQQLASNKVLAVASSNAVQQHLCDMGFTNPLLWENVADAELISSIALGQSREANSVVFLGNLTAAKVAVSLLEAIANTGVTLHLAGPIAEGGGDAERFAPLLTRQNVKYHGVLQPEASAQLMGSCSAGIVPYLANDYTRGVFPMKVYEYLAAGLPVVCSGVPSVSASKDIFCEPNPSDFIARIVALTASAPTPDDIARRLQSAAAHSWSGRGLQAWELITTSPTLATSALATSALATSVLATSVLATSALATSALATSVLATKVSSK